jgi:hypothetical protein
MIHETALLFAEKHLIPGALRLERDAYRTLAVSDATAGKSQNLIS